MPQTPSPWSTLPECRMVEGGWLLLMGTTSSQSAQISTRAQNSLGKGVYSSSRPDAGHQIARVEVCLLSTDFGALPLIYWIRISGPGTQESAFKASKPAESCAHRSLRPGFGPGTWGWANTVARAGWTDGNFVPQKQVVCKFCKYSTVCHSSRNFKVFC